MAEQSSLNTSPSDAPAPARRRRWWIAIGGFGLMLLILLLLIPTFASTGPGSRVVLRIINANISGSVAAEKLNFTWASGQSVTGLTLHGAQGELIFYSERTDAPDVSLLPVAMGSLRLGEIHMDNWHLRLRQQPGQPTNLAQAIAPPDDRSAPPADPDEPLQLGEDVSVRVRATAGRVTYEGPDIETVELTDLNATLDLEDPRRIVVVAEGNIRQLDQVGRVDVNLRLDDAFDAQGRSQFAQARVVDGRADLTNLPTAPIDRMLEYGGQLEALLGPQITGQLRAQGPMTQLDATLTAQSEHLNVDLGLRGTPEQLVATPESQVRLQLTPQAFALLMDDDDPATPAPQLAQPVTLALNIDGLMLPRQGDAFLWQQASAQVNGTASDILLNVPDTEPMALYNTRFSLNTAQLSEQLTATLEAEAQLGNVREPVQAALAVRNALREDVATEADLNLTALPIALADAAAGMDGGLLATLGRTLDAQVNVARQPDGAVTFNAQLDAPQLQGAVAGSVAEDGAISVQTPTPLSLQVTPEAYAFWMASEDAPMQMVLLEPMQVNANVQQFTLAMLDEDAPPPDAPDAPATPDAPDVEDAPDAMADFLARLDPQRTRISAVATSPRARFRDVANNRVVTAEDLQLQLDGADLTDVVQILIQMQVQNDAPGAAAAAPQRSGAQPIGEQPLGRQPIGRQPDAQQPAAQPQQQPQQAQQPGRLRSQMQVRGLVGSDGRMSLEQAAVQSETQIERVPSALLDAVGRQGGSLAAVLGPTTSADLNLTYQGQQGGEATFDLRADHATGRVAASFTPELTLGLREDATLRLSVTPQMAEVLLASINPFLASVTGAQVPLSLTVRQDDFVMPLTEFDWRQVQMTGRLEPAEVTVTPRGALAFVLALIPQRGNGVRANQAYQAMLSGADFDITRGTLAYDRMTLSFMGISLGVGGRVNLAERNLNLQLALGGERMRELGLSEVSLPVRGPIDNPQIEREQLVQALAQSGVRRGLEELIGDNGDASGPLDIIFGQPPRQQQPQEPATGDAAPQQNGEQQPEAEEQPRDPLSPFLDLLRRQQQRDRDRQEQQQQ